MTTDHDEQARIEAIATLLLELTGPGTETSRPVLRERARIVAAEALRRMRIERRLIERIDREYDEVKRKSEATNFRLPAYTVEL